jgi:hypothetical protein
MAFKSQLWPNDSKQFPDLPISRKHSPICASWKKPRQATTVRVTVFVTVTVPELSKLQQGSTTIISALLCKVIWGHSHGHGHGCRIFILVRAFDIRALCWVCAGMLGERGFGIDCSYSFRMRC